MSKPKRLQALAALAHDVERLCYRVGASRWIDELQLVAESQERQHRGGATYAGSVRDAVNYFICKTVLEAQMGPESWRDVCSRRRDYVLGAACREAVVAGAGSLPGAESAAGELESLESRWAELAIGYSEHIAGR